jgi:DNA-binding transcriptional ArsR family regulator
MEYGTKPPPLAEIASKATSDRKQRQRKRRAKEFLRGPVPLNWLAGALSVGKRAIAVGLLLWFRKGCLRGSEELTVSQRQYGQFGLSKATFSRGLRALETAHLVKVDRKPGRKPRIEIVGPK